MRRAVLQILPFREEVPEGNRSGPEATRRLRTRGSPQEKHFENGKATDILEVDISFKEPVHAIQIVELGDAKTTVSAYSLHDLIAEKLRALLQQEKRKRNRRQDIYDIASLLAKFTLDDGEKAELLALLREKCAARPNN